jgi:hypothetical protein
MNRNIAAALVLFVTVAALAGLVGRADSASLPTTDLGATNGYSTGGTQSLSVASDAAVIIGNLPNGCHNIDIISSLDLNYGPSTVSTATTELYVGSYTVKTFEKINVTSPTIYLRPRAAGTTATVRVRFR